MESKIIIVDTKSNDYIVSKEIKFLSSDFPRFIDISRS